MEGEGVPPDVKAEGPSSSVSMLFSVLKLNEDTFSLFCICVCVFVCVCRSYVIFNRFSAYDHEISKG